MIYLVIFILVVFCVVCARFLAEKHEWNKGYSRYDGSKWKYFDMDSQGGRGYIDKSNNVIWISYPFIDRKNRNNQP